MIGTGLMSTTRLSPTPWNMMGDIMATNRDEILAALRVYQSRLAQIESYLESSDFEALQALTRQGAQQYEYLLQARKGET